MKWQIVAYRIDSVYLGATKGKEVRYAYVNYFVNKWSTGEKGYNLIRLKQPNEVPGDCALINSELNPPIFMRKATEGEVALIRKAVTDGQAQFDYKRHSRLNALLKGRISKL